METERIETSIGFETAGVDKGAQRVEKAFDRLNAAEQKSIKLAQAQQAEAARKTLDAAKSLEKEKEKLSKEFSDRRVAITQAEYKKMAALEKTRQTELVQSLKMNQIRAGISPSGSASGRAGAGGGHGGPHGGLLGGNARLFGDMLDSATSTNGWVMKLRALEHIGPALGRMLIPGAGIGAIAALGYEGYKANSRMVAATQNGQKAMGEAFQSPWMTNPFTGPLLRMLPAWMQPGVTVARRDAASAEGMHEESASIRAAMEKEQESRGGFGGFSRAFLRTTLAGLPIAHRAGGILDRRMDESFGIEGRQQDKLNSLDARQAGLVQGESMARHIGIAIDPLQGELAKHRIELEQHNAALDDQFRGGSIGLQERHAGRAAARQDQEDADRESNRKEQLSNIGLNEASRLNILRGQGGNEVQSATVRLDEAKHAKEAAVGDLENKSADNKIEAAKTDLDLAERNLAIRRDGLAIDMRSAKERGNSDQRERAAADAAQDRANANLRGLEASQATTAEELKQARIEVDRANTARILLNREQAVARMQAVSSDDQANIRFRATGGTLGAGVSVHQTAELQAQVDIAKNAREEAQKKMEIEGQSVKNVEALHAAQARVATSLLQQKEYELDLNRTRRMELASLRTDVAATRLANVGRGEAGEVLKERQSTDADEQNALRDNNPALAAELGESQRARETGRFLKKYYTPDGRKRDRGKINAEERDARITQGRLQRAGDRFERDGGLLNVTRDISGRVTGGTDPFTHQHVTAAELRQRQAHAGAAAAADKAAGDASLAGIMKILDQRLPARN